MKHRQCHLQHTLSPMHCLTLNPNVSKLLDFMLQWQNPNIITVNVPVPLHNALTKQAVDWEVAVCLLNCLKNGERVYRAYRYERQVIKENINATISKWNIPKFTDRPQKTPATIMIKQKEVTAKYVAEAHRNIAIAKERGMSLIHILSHDLLPMSPLFDSDLLAHVSKLTLVDDIEAGLTRWGRPSGCTTHVIVDFMSKIHVVLISNDTDTLALLLHYIPHWQSLWREKNMHDSTAW